MEIEVKLFATVADRARRHSVHLELAEEASVADLKREIAKKIPEIGGLMPIIMVAVNHEFAADDLPLSPGDEVALIPPVSGGSPELSGEPDPGTGGTTRLPKKYEVTSEPLSCSTVESRARNPMAGAVLVFVGTVREFTRGRRTLHLIYEAYPEMAEKKLAEIGREIETRWPGSSVAISHRTGKLEIGEASVVIAVATPHRPEAFEAGRFAIEQLKKIVPIWKKEVYEDGEEWVGPGPQEI